MLYIVLAQHILRKLAVSAPCCVVGYLTRSCCFRIVLLHGEYHGSVIRLYVYKLNDLRCNVLFSGSRECQSI